MFFRIPMMGILSGGRRNRRTMRWNMGMIWREVNFKKNWRKGTKVK